MLQGEAAFPLNPNFRGSYATIAARVGVDEDTVRHRVKSFHETGFLGEWRLQLNPTIWGGGQIIVFIGVDPNEPKDDLVEELKLLPGALIVTSFQSRIGVVLGFDEEATLPRQVELVRRLSGSDDVLVGRYAFPACSIELSARDWDLIRALRKNPRKSRTGLSRELGVSPRTISRKLERIVCGGVAFGWPSPNPRAIGAGVLASLYVTFCQGREPEVDKLISTHLEPYQWHKSVMLAYRRGELPVTGYELAVPNLSVVTDVLSWARQTDGVEAVRADLYEDIVTNFQSYDDYLDGKLRGMPTAMPTVTMTATRTLRNVAEHTPRAPRRPAVKSALGWSGS